MNVTLPISIQREGDETRAAPVMHTFNISGGGLGIIVTTTYEPQDVILVTVLLPDAEPFSSTAEVMRLEPVPAPERTYRLHARFVNLPGAQRERLIRYIVHFQREHLKTHYSV